MAYQPPPKLPNRPIALLLLFMLGVVLAAALGVAGNIVNVQVSEEYFRAVLRWHDVEDIQRAVIAQGLFEGVLFGLLFATLFVIVVGCVSRVRCPFSMGLKTLLGIVVGAALLWAVGGGIAVGLASLSPEFYQSTFFGVPDDPQAMLRYAWVGGSIWGLELGGFVSLVIGCVMFYSKWRRYAEQKTAPQPPTTI